MEDYTSEMIKDMAFSFCLSAVQPLYRIIKQTEKVLLTGMPVKMEQHPPKAGKLENSAVKDLSGVRQGVFLPTSVRAGTEILQPGLCQPGQRKGGKRCSR